MIMRWLPDYRQREQAGTEPNRCIFLGVVQLVERLVWDQEARRFKSCHLDYQTVFSVVYL